jgi:menaquinone-dependent protoporphyrinogen oxidase
MSRTAVVPLKAAGDGSPGELRTFSRGGRCWPGGRLKNARSEASQKNGAIAVEAELARPGWRHPMNNPERRPQVLVSAASEHGSTTDIARIIGQTLADSGVAVDIVPPAAVDSIEGYDAVILGSAVYAGHWLAAARNFAIRFRDPLASLPVWLFSSGPVGDPSRKLVQSMGQDPADVLRIRRAIQVRGHRTFAGKLNPQALGVAQRASLLVFRDLSGDFRDWAAITQWADGIAADLTANRTHGTAVPGLKALPRCRARVPT